MTIEPQSPTEANAAEEVTALELLCAVTHESEEPATLESIDAALRISTSQAGARRIQQIARQMMALPGMDAADDPNAVVTCWLRRVQGVTEHASRLPGDDSGDYFPTGVTLDMPISGGQLNIDYYEESVEVVAVGGSHREHIQAPLLVAELSDQDWTYNRRWIMGRK